MKTWLFVGRDIVNLFKKDFMRDFLGLKYIFLVLYNVSPKLYSALMDYVNNENPQVVYLYDISNTIRASYPQNTKFFPEEFEDPWVPLKTGIVPITGEVKIAGGLIYSDRIILALTTNKKREISIRSLTKKLFVYEREFSDNEIDILLNFYRPDILIEEIKTDESQSIFLASNDKNLILKLEDIILKIFTTKKEEIIEIETSTLKDLENVDIFGDVDLIEKIKNLIANR